MRILELCSGSHVLSDYFRNRGHFAISVDNNPETRPTVVADIRDLPLPVQPFDLIWAGVPCTQFSLVNTRANKPAPDLSIYRSAVNIIKAFSPRYYCIENVKGAERFFGPPAQIVMPFYLWTNLPYLHKPRRAVVKTMGIHRPDLAATYPVWFIERIYNAVTNQVQLPLV